MNEIGEMNGMGKGNEMHDIPDWLKKWTTNNEWGIECNMKKTDEDEDDDDDDDEEDDDEYDYDDVDGDGDD